MSDLKFGVIMDPIEKIDIEKDTTFVLMLEAQARGHEIYYMGLRDLYVRDTTPEAQFCRINVARATPHYQFGATSTQRLDWFDVVLMRKDPPFDLNYFFATHLLSLVDDRKCLVVNNPMGLREATEKLYALNFPEVIPPSIITSSIPHLKKFMGEQGGEMILKPLEGCGGQGVFYLNLKDRNLNVVLELATVEGKIPVMAQRYLPEIRVGDKRILVLDGDPIGAVLRVPREDDNRANIHVGGNSVRAKITPRDREICRVLSEPFKKLGLYFVGLDVIGDYLTEVNVTSPTCVQEINALDGVHLEGQIIDFIERKAAEQQRARR